MTKEEQEKLNKEGGAQVVPPAGEETEAPSVDERPNRTAFSKRFLNVTQTLILRTKKLAMVR